MPFFDRVVGSSGIYVEPRNRPVRLIERLSGQGRTSRINYPIWVKRRNRPTRFKSLSVEGYGPFKKRILFRRNVEGIPRLDKIKSLAKRRPLMTRVLTTFNPVGVRVKLFGERIPRVYDRGRY